jgi:cytochrome c-type protein NapB
MRGEGGEGMSEAQIVRNVIVLSLAVALAAGCAVSERATPAASAPPAPIADASLGLAKGSVFDVATPPAVKANDKAPGEEPVLPRAYVIAPPRIPHVVADFLPITRKQNACLDCHGVKDKKPGEPTPIPPSHYTDYRRAPDRVGGAVVGARYVCVSCHPGTTDAPGLVGNDFRR